MFENAIIIGTGKLAFSCAKILCEKKVKCKIFEYNEYSYSQLAFLCQKAEIEYCPMQKTELTNYLSNINKPTLVVSANNTYIFPKQIIEKDNFLIINFHPALLPNHPGRNAEAWSIYDGDKITGITWHLVDEKIDHGKIVYQQKIEIDSIKTSLQLMSNQIVLAIKGFEEIADSLIQNKLTFIETEKTEENKQIHYSKDIPNNGELNLQWSIPEISRFLRAMDYGKMSVLGQAYLIYQGKRYIWDKYKIHDNSTNENSNINKGVFCDSKQMITLINIRESSGVMSSDK